ncbi:MAG: D-alanyl-D-alanine carboxypeptidase family protein [Clostridia bacterium]
MKKLCCFLALICLLVSLKANFGTNFCSYAESSSAKGMCVIEQSTKRILYEKNANKCLAMASTTKIMTALTTLSLCTNLDEKVNIDPKAVGITGTSMYLRKGEVLTVRELLYGMMLPSGNDAAVALAIHAAGSEEKFVAEMNLQASKLGANYTHFANPHGLDERGHFTTAFDLALITAKALENKDFLEISMTKSKQVKGSKEGTVRYLKNKNRLLSSMEGCTGVKTGFTDDAGRCFVASIDKNGLKAVCVVLGCGPMFEESQYLLQLATNEYQMFNVSDLMKSTLPVENSAITSLNVETKDEILYPFKKSEIDSLKVELDLPEKIVAPAIKGTIIGKAKVFCSGRLLFEKDMFIMEDAKPIQTPEPTKSILKNWF